MKKLLANLFAAHALALLLGLPTFASAQVSTVNVTAPDPVAVEATKDPGGFAVSRTGGSDAALTVTYSVEGSATPGKDYTALPGSVTIPAGESTVIIKVIPLQDGIAEKAETLVLTLTESSLYTVGAPASAVVTIKDK